MVTSVMMSVESDSFPKSRCARVLRTNWDQPCMGTSQQEREEVRFRILWLDVGAQDRVATRRALSRPNFEPRVRTLSVRLHTSSATNRSSARSLLSSFVVKHSSINSHSRSPSLLGCVIFLIPSSNSHCWSSLFLWWQGFHRLSNLYVLSF